MNMQIGKKHLVGQYTGCIKHTVEPKYFLNL